MKLKEKANLALGLAIVMLIVMIGCAVCAIGAARCWFGHAYGEDGICTKCGAQAPASEELEDDGGLDVGPEVQARGMRLASVKIPRPQFSEEGIEPLAESAQQLTATITPADAINQEVDWKIEWVNASSSWAKGKTVTDYVTIAPTSDGALTANLTCLQAFAEQIIVTVTVRSDAGFYATALVDYEKRILGFDFAIGQTWEGNEYVSPVQWNMTTANLTATVDLPFMSSVFDGTNVFQQNWIMAYDYTDSDYVFVTVTPHYSIYTKDRDLSSVKIQVAPTSSYLAALQAAGLNGGTPGFYVTVYEGDLSEIEFSVVDLMMDCMVSNENEFAYYEDYAALRTALREKIDSTMMQIKIECPGGDSRDAITIYNVKFSEDSVSPVVEGITVTPDNIEF